MTITKIQHFRYRWRPEYLTLHYAAHSDRKFSSLAVVPIGEVEWRDGDGRFLGVLPGPLMRDVPKEVFSELTTHISQEKSQKTRAVIRQFHALPDWVHQVSAKTCQELRAIAVMDVIQCDGRGEWTFPDFEGDAAFLVHGSRSLNPRKVARLNGLVYCRWTGFNWQRGDY